MKTWNFSLAIREFRNCFKATVMSAQLLLLLLLLTTLSTVSIAQIQQYSPCDDYLKIVQPEIGSFQGELTFPLQVGRNRIDLRFSQRGQQNQANVGNLLPYPDEATVRANMYAAHFRLSLFPDAMGVLPKLTRFAFNDMPICTATGYNPETFFNRYYMLQIYRPQPPRRVNSVPVIPTFTDSDVEIKAVAFDDQESISHILSDFFNERPSTSAPSWQPFNPVATITTTTPGHWQIWQPTPPPPPPPAPWTTTSTTPAPHLFFTIDPPVNRKLTPSFRQPLSIECGLENTYTPFIQKGREVSRGMYPWLAVVYHKESFSLIFKCGGSLVSASMVITAAHCVHQVKEDRVSVGLGRFDLDNHDEDGAERREVLHILNHPEYSTRPALQPDADISLITLARPVTFNDVISPICLWKAEHSETTVEFGTVAGWGRDETGNTTRYPRSVTTKIASEVECANSWKVPKVLARAICAGNLDNSGPCLGDSGGGLMIKLNNRWLLRGVVSLGQRNSGGSCNNTQYVLYCDLSKHLSWISNNMG